MTTSLIGRLLCFFGRHKDAEAIRFSAKELLPVIGFECAHCTRRTLALPLIQRGLDKATERRAKRQTEHAAAWRDRSPDHQPKPRGRKPRAPQQPPAEDATPPLLQLTSAAPDPVPAHE